MSTRPLGPSGLSVSPIGFGGMPISIVGRPDEAVSVRVIHAALDAGMTLIDTADVYCMDGKDIGHNERLIANALKAWPGKKDAVVVATKGGCTRGGVHDWGRNGRPEHLKKACEASLKALGVAAIDLYQLHAPDPAVPYADTLGALADLRKTGKVRHVGLSNVSVPQIREAQKIVPIASVQNRCSILDRSAWADGVIPYCEKNGIAFLPYCPVGGSRGKEKLGQDRTLNAVAKRIGATPYQVALAWLLAKSPVAIPIPGASKPENAVSSAKAMGIVLSPKDMAELDKTN